MGATVVMAAILSVIALTGAKGTHGDVDWKTVEVGKASINLGEVIMSAAVNISLFFGVQFYRAYKKKGLLVSVSPRMWTPVWYDIY